MLLCAVAVLVLGCGRHREQRTADGRLVIDYWEKWTGFEGDAMQAVIDDFNASQPRLFVKRLVVSQIDQKLMLATAGGNPPDLAGLWSHTVPDFAEKGALTPLDGLARRAGIGADRYTPVFWKLCRHRDLLWALPTTPATMALHWNRRLFREAGLDPDRPPRSLAELDAMAERLTIVSVVRDGARVKLPFTNLTVEERAAREFAIEQMGFMPSQSWFAEMWGYWFGGDLWDGTGRITADSPANLAAFRWYRGYPERYGVRNLQSFGASFGNFASPQNPFLGGQLAMVLQGTWMHNFIGKYAPQMDWAAAPFPSADPAKLPDVSIAECDVLVIPRGTRHAAEAFEFMRYLAGQGPAEKLALGQRKFSPLAETSPAFVAAHPNPYIGVFIALAKSPNVRTAPRLTVWKEYRDEMAVALNRLDTLKAAPETALAEVRLRMQQKLDRLSRRWELVREQRMKEWQDHDAR
ncbi:MAG: ABC transporter substrate-binding protein [Kiritimatiellae bacterium]|nr:ABC transporter substrate-binding protein [Kiritimatiellia bacterium]